MVLINVINEEIQNLNEGLSEILYHFTYIPHLVNILSMDKFATSSNLGSAADSWKDKGKYFFFSTQRSKGKSGYGRNHGNVCLVLDGKKLNQRYKGFPTDYWNWSKSPKDYDNKSNYIQALQSSELEDRIITDKPYIENAKQYIIGIHILSGNEYRSFLKKAVLDNILQQVGNIPIYFYDDENSFKLLDTRKAINVNDINLLDPDEDYDNLDRSLEPLRYFRYIAPIIIYKNTEAEESIKNLLNKFLESVNKTDGFESAWKDIQDNVKKFGGSWGYNDDVYRSLSADIHNMRGNPNPYFREMLKLLITDIKNYNVKTLKDYVHKKLNR
jgi:hypothetical protein